MKDSIHMKWKVLEAIARSWEPCARKLFRSQRKLYEFREPIPRSSGIPPVTPKWLAGQLLIPAVPICLAAFYLIPWMLETKRRLQNNYWEGQLAFATVALSIAAAGLPFLLLLVFCSARIVAISSWLVVVLGYAAVFTYMVQSHFPIAPKLVIGILSGAFAAVAGYALRLDLLIAKTRK
jgi:hypothetical protein